MFIIITILTFIFVAVMVISREQVKLQTVALTGIIQKIDAPYIFLQSEKQYIKIEIPENALVFAEYYSAQDPQNPELTEKIDQDMIFDILTLGDQAKITAVKLKNQYLAQKVIIIRQYIIPTAEELREFYQKFPPNRVPILPNINR